VLSYYFNTENVQTDLNKPIASSDFVLIMYMKLLFYISPILSQT